MYKEVVLRDNPLGFWMLDDRGDILKDQSKNNTDGSLESTGGALADSLEAEIPGFDPMVLINIDTTFDMPAHCGVNTHWNFPGWYESGETHRADGANTGNHANPEVITVMENGGWTCWRQRISTNNPVEMDAIDNLPDWTVVGTLGDLTTGNAEIIDIVNHYHTLCVSAGTTFVDFALPNEPNAHGGTTWPGKIKNQAGWARAAIDSHTWPDRTPELIGPGLMHNPKGGPVQYDKDIASLKAQHLEVECDAGDFHFYPGNNGPGYRMNGKDTNGNIPAGITLGPDGKCTVTEFELQRVRAAYHDANFKMYHTEYGWTSTDTFNSDFADMAVEANLRHYNLGMAKWFHYELADEWPYQSETGNKHEGEIGLYVINPDGSPSSTINGHNNPGNPHGPKPPYTAIKKLLTYPGAEDINGLAWLKDIAGTLPDCNVNAFSKGGGKWDLYFTRNAINNAHLVLDSGYEAVGYNLDPNGFYNIPLNNQMVVVEVVPSAGGGAPVWQQDNPPNGTISVPYTYTFKATGSPTYTLESGTLPNGLALNSSTGVLSGTPTLAAEFVFKVRAENAFGFVVSPNLTVDIVGAPVFINQTPTNGFIGTSYHYNFTASGFPDPTFSVFSGSLPPGLTLAGNGRLAGTPTTGGTYNFVVRATNSAGHADTGTLSVAILSGSGGSAPPSFVDESPPTSGVVGDAFDYLFTASGSPAPTFSTTDTLPPGITLATDGDMSGTFTTAGTWNYVITATNSHGTDTTPTLTLTVTDDLSAPVFIQADPIDGNKGSAYTYTFIATGNPAPTYTIQSGTGTGLPAGLSLNASTGVLSGTPTASGKFTFVVTASNSQGSVDTALLTIKMFDAPNFVNQDPPDGTVGVAYSYRFTVTGYPNSTFSVTSGTIPAGLTLNTTTGKLSGTPTTATTYNFAIGATNGHGTDNTGTVSVVIGSGGGTPTAPQFVDADPPDGTMGVVYDYLFTASGYPAPTFSVSSGTLPTGLVLTTDGELSGTPSATGTFVFSVEAHNGVSPPDDTGNLTVIIGTGGGGGGKNIALMPLVESMDRALRFDNTVIAEYPLKSPVYMEGTESKAFSLEAWAIYIPKPSGSPSDQVVLGSKTSVDGIVLHDKTITFRLRYDTAPDAFITYEMPIYQKMHIVATYEITRIRLYVNGKEIETQDLTADQIDDTFSRPGSSLFSGYNANDQTIGLNCVAVYDYVLSPRQVKNHYVYGNLTNPAANVSDPYNATQIPINRSVADISLYKTWQTDDDWNEGYLVDCAAQNDVLVASLDDNDLTVAGTWQTSFLLEPVNGDTVFGVLADWDGVGVQVAMSLDAINWTAVQPGVRTTLVPDGTNVVDKDMFLQVQFEAGLESASLNSISAIVFETGEIQNKSGRTITLAGPVSINSDIEPFYQTDRGGIYMQNGVLTITNDTDTDIPSTRTVELWVKLLNATDLLVKINGVALDDPVNCKQYKNGVTGRAQPAPGEWTIITYVANTDFTDDITIQHNNLLITNIVLYQDALTAEQINDIYRSYMGIHILAVTDDAVVQLTGAAEEGSVYSHDWTVTGGG